MPKASPRCGKSVLDGRASWRLQNDGLSVEMLQAGGHVAVLQLHGTRAPAGVNPLWKPPWKGLDPDRFAMARDGRRFGGNSESRLLAGIRGHNLCFDYWGAPSEAELAAGMSFHGEAGLIRWKLRSARAGAREAVLVCEADLRQSAARMTRTVRLRAGERVAYFEETAENRLALDRAIGWVEHVTVGPPFLRRGETLLDMPVTRGITLPGTLGRVPPETEVDWPYVPAASGGGAVDLRVAAPEQRSGFDIALVIAPGRELGFIAAATPRLGLLVAYVFRRREFPWVNFWEQNRAATLAPWNGRALSVGLEFGNSIVSGSRPAMAASPPERFGTPTYAWMAALQKLTVRYVALLSEVPRDFHGVADIQARERTLVIVERDTGREIALACDTRFLQDQRSGRRA